MNKEIMEHAIAEARGIAESTTNEELKILLHKFVLCGVSVIGAIRFEEVAKDWNDNILCCHKKSEDPKVEMKIVLPEDVKKEIDKMSLKFKPCEDRHPVKPKPKSSPSKHRNTNYTLFCMRSIINKWVEDNSITDIWYQVAIDKDFKEHPIDNLVDLVRKSVPNAYVTKKSVSTVIRNLLNKKKGDKTSELMRQLLNTPIYRL